MVQQQGDKSREHDDAGHRCRSSREDELRQTRPPRSGDVRSPRRPRPSALERDTRTGAQHHEPVSRQDRPRTPGRASRPIERYASERSQSEQAASRPRSTQDGRPRRRAQQVESVLVRIVAGVIVGLRAFVSFFKGLGSVVIKGRRVPVWSLIVGAIAVVVAVALISSAASSAHAQRVLAEQQAASEAAASAEAQAASEAAANAAAAYQGVEDPWVSSGYFTTGDAELDQMVKDLCDANSSADKDFSDNAYNTYLQITWMDYVERDSNQNPEGADWAVTYAKQLVTENSGNCYNFTAMTQWILRYFGYTDAFAQPCIVHLQSGNWGDHGLVFVTNVKTGERCFCDDALSSKGWMLAIDTYEYTIKDVGQGNLTTEP